jgi:hypothetical protein
MKRWENDRQYVKGMLENGNYREKFGLLGRDPLTVKDYRHISQTKITWEFIDSLKLPGLQCDTARMIIQCPRLLVYFDLKILRDLFTALLIDNEDPKKYVLEFAWAQQKYGRLAEQIIEEIKNSSDLIQH